MGKDNLRASNVSDILHLRGEFVHRNDREPLVQPIGLVMHGNHDLEIGEILRYPFGLLRTDGEVSTDGDEEHFHIGERTTLSIR